ncbi:MAG: AI-2E family transporter [Nitrospirae bacterium]|nr:AI-2E family transporter [Nitrospirota bacterium]
MKDVERIYATVSTIIFLGLLFLFYKILRPFLVPIGWAMVLSVTFYPLFNMLVSRLKRPWAASLITLVIILIIIAGPVTYILTALMSEIADTFNTIQNRGFDAVTRLQENQVFSDILNKIGSFTEDKEINLNEAAMNSLKSLGGFMGQHVSDVFKNIFAFAMNFVIMFLAIFYFLKDGERLTEYLKRFLPFPADQKRELTIRVKEMVIAAIYGGVAVGVTQGILGGVAFWVLGLPSPVFWGTVMAIVSFIPLFGTFIVWGPAGLILILGGSLAKGIGLMLYGFLVISMVDNILKPLIIGGRTRLPTLLIFFSVLGGIGFFGFIGFILGPIIAVLCISVLEIYAATSLDHQKEDGESAI